ncbi:MAG: TraC family protein, partial [Sulfurimonas sp.]
QHSKRAEEEPENAKFLNDAIDEIVNFIRAKTKESCSSSMVSKMKKVRVFFSFVTIKKVNKNEITRFKHDMINVLHSNGFMPIVTTPESLLELNYEVFNPSVSPLDFPTYDKSKYINKQMVSTNAKIIVDDDFIEFDKEKTWLNLTPQSISQKFHIWEFGSKLGDSIGESLDSNQFNDSFMINLTVVKKSKKATKKATKNHAVISTQTWGEMFRKFQSVKRESIDILDRVDEKKEELFEFDMDVLISGTDYKDALLNAQVIESFWNKSGDGYSKIKLDKTKGIHHLALLNAMPMAASTEYFYDIGGKFRTLFSNQIAHFIPLEADSTGEGFNLPLGTRRANLAFVDLFVSSTNYNGGVFATSGAGKSVLLNMLGFMSYARKDKLFVLDYDNSFTGLIESTNGQYLELNPDIKPISFNPFSDLQNREDLMVELPYLSAFIYLLGSSKSVARAEEDEKLIKTEMQQLILSQYDMLKTRLEITHIRDAILKEHGDDKRFSDFARQLGQYCRNGMYEKWFSGPCEFTMEKDIMAVEFKGVESHEDLRDPLIMLLLYHIGKVMYSTDPNKPRVQIILDEAHRFIGKNPRMDDFIEQAYRRAKKFNVSIILATQGFDDIYDGNDLSRVGKVINNNSAWKFFLKQTTPSVEGLIKSKLFGFDALNERELRSVKTKKGEYSEMFVISPSENKTIFRLLMPPFFYYLTTTDQTDKRLIHDYMEKYQCSRFEAIKRIANDKKAS